MKKPYISVVIPGHNAAKTLPECLQALSSQSLDRASYEIIYVDDSSSDDSLRFSESWADKTIKLENGPHLSGAARNAAVEAAAGEVLIFIDADIVVLPNTLEMLSAWLLPDSRVDAVFGSYDDSPRAPGLVSQYRNLLHHHVHQTGNQHAATFWSGCGAIKKSAFLKVGGFPTGVYVEDVELGKELRVKGMEIRLILLFR